MDMDYHPELIRATQEASQRWGTQAGAARASAEVAPYQLLEERLASFLGVDNVVVYTTVTLANHGVIPLLMRKGTLILLDWEAHSSVQRAAIEAKGAGAALLNFAHDDFEQLEKMLQRLNQLIDRVKQGLRAIGFELVGEDRPFPLILVKVGDVYAAPKVSQFLFDEGIHVLTTGFPIVPLARGAMVRISLAATHTDAQIERLLEVFRKLHDSPLGSA